MNKCLIFFSVAILANTSYLAPETDAKEINLKRYSHSNIHSSRDRKSIIVVDYVSSEIGSCPERATLYTLPLDSGKRKEIFAVDRYEWSHESNWIVTQNWVPPEELDKHYPILKTTIVIYDANGNELSSPGFGTSPTFSIFKDEIIYFSEFSEKGERTSPKLIAYNIPKKEKKTIYTFDDKYTFWVEQIDSFYNPKPVDYMWGGLRGTIRLKQSLNKNFTFVVSYTGELKEWIKGDQMHLEYPPKKK